MLFFGFVHLDHGKVFTRFERTCHNAFAVADAYARISRNFNLYERYTGRQIVNHKYRLTFVLFGNRGFRYVFERVAAGYVIPGLLGVKFKLEQLLPVCFKRSAVGNDPVLYAVTQTIRVTSTRAVCIRVPTVKHKVLVFGGGNRQLERFAVINVVGLLRYFTVSGVVSYGVLIRGQIGVKRRIAHFTYNARSKFITVMFTTVGYIVPTAEMITGYVFRHGGNFVAVSRVNGFVSPVGVIELDFVSSNAYSRRTYFPVATVYFHRVGNFNIVYAAFPKFDFRARTVFNSRYRAADGYYVAVCGSNGIPGYYAVFVLNILHRTVVYPANVGIFGRFTRITRHDSANVYFNARLTA